ncbi:hypothetical protein FCM35_KLT15808 [Carex littledalei]|uniref:Uncharacterized protein n=1 Tax=Carex littledalei TaxID=544730 RepID=A0A833RF93_9POAL|nr:hypothetical protein FCM35_KLT15808 [Carex littledalei]
METNSSHVQSSNSDGETDDGSESFDKRQLIGAETETESTNLLPEVEGLCITGEARPGHTIQATGEKKPEYLVTADDVESYLAVEVIPIGKGEQIGDLVRIFANEHKKITCGNEMQDAVEQNFFNGHASFDAYLVGYYDDRQRVKLEFTKDRFIIKDGKLHPIVNIIFLPDMMITIPGESPTGFEIHSIGASLSLKLETENSTLRDLIVLTMRSFLLRVRLAALLPRTINAQILFT